MQALHAAGIARIDEAFYLAPRFGWPGAMGGDMIFGLGMALVGTCGHGVLVRVSGGDMRALVTLLVLGLTAYMTARGLTAHPRIWLFEILGGRSVGPGRPGPAPCAGRLDRPVARRVVAAGGGGHRREPDRLVSARSGIPDLGPRHPCRRCHRPDRGGGFLDHRAPGQCAATWPEAC